MRIVAVLAVDAIRKICIDKAEVLGLESFNENEFVDAVRAHHAIATTGPFLTMRVNGNVEDNPFFLDARRADRVDGLIGELALLAGSGRSASVRARAVAKKHGQGSRT